MNATSGIDDRQWQAIVDAIVAGGPWDSDGPVDSIEDDRADLCSAPGVGLVRALARAQPRGLRGSDALSYLRATERAMAWLTALQAEALVAIAGPRSRIDAYELPDAPVITIEDAARSEIAAATTWSEPWAHDRITTARLLDGPLALTRAALTAGEISGRTADVIAAAAQRLSGWTAWITADVAETASVTSVRDFERMCAELESAALPTARSRGLSATRRAADRIVTRIDADHAAMRRRRALTCRDVTVHEEGDGISVLTARLATEQAHACLAVVDAMARRLPSPVTAGTPRPAAIGERRAEAIVRLILRDAAPPPDAATGEGTPIRTHVEVVIDLATLLGLADHPATLRSGGPGGPVLVGAEVVRRLIADDPHATVRRLVCDPLTGHLLDRARTAYRVPDALRAFVTTRDATCRFPGCQRRADLTQLDHAVAWDDGGGTTRANLGALCVRHHQLKTHADWQIIHSSPDGSCRWRSPLGLSYERVANVLP